MKVKTTDPGFKEWLAACQKKVDEYMEHSGYAPLQKTKLRVAKGSRRYIKVTALRLIQNTEGEYKVNGESAWAFIDTTNGDILKPASWKAPAKHSRGNLFDSNKGLGMVGPQGPAYLR